MPRKYERHVAHVCRECGASNIQGGDMLCMACARDDGCDMTEDEVDAVVREQELTADWGVRWRDIPSPGRVKNLPMQCESPKDPLPVRGRRVIRKGVEG